MANEETEERISYLFRITRTGAILVKVFLHTLSSKFSKVISGYQNKVTNVYNALKISCS